MTKNNYAVIQCGFVVCGVGTTSDEAIENARGEGLCGEIKTEFNGIHGECYVLPCSKELRDAVGAVGGDISFDVEEGVVVLWDYLGGE